MKQQGLMPLTKYISSHKFYDGLIIWMKTKNRIGKYFTQAKIIFLTTVLAAVNISVLRPFACL